MRPNIRLASALTLASVALSARAEDAYSSLGVAPDVYGMGGYVASPGYPIAFRFVATGSGRLTGLTAALKSESGSAVPFDLTIYADGPDETVGPRIAFGAESVCYYALDLNTTELVETSLLGGPTIQAGEAYWAEADFFSAPGDWCIALTGDRTLERSGGADGTYYHDINVPAFSVQVAPVPEPASLAALNLGALALLRRRKR